MRYFEVDGIMIEIEKKKMKNMYLKVLPPDGRIHISAPMGVSDDTIKQFVLSRLDWIKLQQGKMHNRHLHEYFEYVSGEAVYLWGKKYSLEVIFAGYKAVAIENDKLILKTRAMSTVAQREEILNAFYKEKLCQEIPILVVKWESVIGVHINGWNIRDMKTRWGTCNVRDKRITLNLQLVKKQPDCLEYVIVHELVHLLERSHNHVFKSYMDQFLPDWRIRKNILNGLE